MMSSQASVFFHRSDGTFRLIGYGTDAAPQVVTDFVPEITGDAKATPVGESISLQRTDTL